MRSLVSTSSYGCGADKANRWVAVVTGILCVCCTQVGSLLGSEGTCARVQAMSALPLKADIQWHGAGDHRLWHSNTARPCCVKIQTKPATEYVEAATSSKLDNGDRRSRRCDCPRACK